MENLQSKSIKELQAMAREMNLSGRSKMNKAELVLAITASQNVSQLDAETSANMDLQFFAQEVESEYVVGLNDSQKEAVLTIDGTIQICSVAGSGKTRVLTNRTAYMINDKKIDPSSMMLTTFTSKASKEMEERLSSMISKGDMNLLTLGTTHSIGLSFLKEWKELTEYPSALMNLRTGLLQGWKQTKLIKDIAKQLEDKYKKSADMAVALDTIKPPMYMKVVSAYKNQNLSPVEVWHIDGDDNNNAKVGLYKEFYGIYEYEKRKMQAIDFDDMLYLSVRLLQENPKVLETLQRRYKYIMVDEAQDNNLLQYELIRMLGFPEYNLFIVGDDDQSMYRFRGASPESFIGLKNEYQAVKQIFLPLNYRSHADILETANKLIHKNVNRISKRLIPANNNSVKSVFYNVYHDEDSEALGIVNEILRKEEMEESSLKDIACLFRTNAQSRAIEDQLIIKGIPYKLHGGVSFYQRAEIMDLLAYLQLAHDNFDNTAFKRVYNKPNRYLGNAFYEKVSNGKSHFQTMRATMFAGKQRDNVNEFRNIIDTIIRMSNNREPLQDMITFVLDKGYKEWLLGEDFDSEADSPKLENINTLLHLLTHFETLDAFINHLDRVMNTKNESDNSIQLMTIHKSKGLEFKTVFVMGVSEGILPHFRALEEVTDTNNNPLEEERRLCYVAVTRAEQECYISSVMTYNGKSAGISRFVDEMGINDDDKEGDTTPKTA